jgi:hypothetical protein
MEIIMKSFKRVALGGTALLAIVAASAAFPSASHADTFFFTSCHVSGSACQGGNIAPPGFGSVTATGSGTTLTVDVTLINGNKFVETGSGANELFLFNAVVGTTVSNLSATFNGTDVTTTLGGLTFVNHAPGTVNADGTGDWTGSIECTVASNCNGNSIVTTVNDLHFTVSGITLTQLESRNDEGNIFAADILCGATQPGCNSGLTGPIDVNQVPGPVLGAGLPGLIAACVGLVGLARRRRQKMA